MEREKTFPSAQLLLYYSLIIHCKFIKLNKKKEEAKYHALRMLVCSSAPAAELAGPAAGGPCVNEALSRLCLC